ncbi:hypothetical protein [Undibacterium sp.]|uniref:hypothetical protein n=1 Tax=Undibacterium sp. TaxID=1914977 RepID=UPI0025F9297A|nr:hypothetical protein [Undibacterium sp.]
MDLKLKSTQSSQTTQTLTTAKVKTLGEIEKIFNLTFLSYLTVENRKTLGKSDVFLRNSKISDAVRISDRFFVYLKEGFGKTKKIYGKKTHRNSERHNAWITALYKG